MPQLIGLVAGVLYVILSLTPFYYALFLGVNIWLCVVIWLVASGLSFLVVRGLANLWIDALYR